MLSTKNVQLHEHTSRKLIARFVGPFRVLKKVGLQAYRLQLPDSMRHIHPMFHISLLRKPADPTLGPGTSLAAGPGPINPPVATDDQLWELENIINQ